MDEVGWLTMIGGIGTDMVRLQRIEKAYQRYGQQLAVRLLHPQELPVWAAANSRVNFLAKRFAAKEAFAKAVGTGIRGEVSFAKIGIRHNALGRPEFFYAPSLAAWLTEQQIVRVHLSLSDEDDRVLAFALAEIV